MLREVSFLAGLGLGLAVAIGLGLAASSSGAVAASASAAAGGGVATCPEKLTGTASLVCDCPSEATASGSVWGSDVYTDDSAICRAALHAGAIGTDGGRIWVHEAPGQSGYPAVTRNSVASSNWGQWGRSITFGPVDEADNSAFRRTGEACPQNATALGMGARLTCGCGEGSGNGTVWGSGPYTADSAICSAAVHAGVIGPGGGEVSLRIVGGRASYQGSNRNGVSSNNWGSYASSIVFER